MRRHDRVMGVLTHRATMDATPLLTADDTRVSIDRVLVNHVLDRADSQSEVSIVGSYLRAPTSGTRGIALRRQTRYWLVTARCVRQTEKSQSGGPITVELVGYSDGCPLGWSTFRHESHRAVVLWRQTAVH